MAVFSVMGALPLSRQEVCGGDHRNPPLKNLGSGEYCVKGGSSNSKGCQGYLATGSFKQVKSVVNASGTCGLSHWSFDGDDEETPRPTKTDRPRPTKTPDPEPSATPDPTPTDRPTITPDPTETSIPPTKTPRPDPSDTPKPDPSDTPRPKPTDTPKPKPPTNTPKPSPATPTRKPNPSATLPPPTMTLTATQLVATETPYVCVVCGCPCGSQTPIVVEVIAEAPDLSPIAEELKPIFYTLVAIFVALGGNLIFGVYNSFKK